MASRAALGNPAVAVARKHFTVLLITDGMSPSLLCPLRHCLFRRSVFLHCSDPVAL